jgi:hypothetical protein
MSVIPAIHEIEIGRIVVGGLSRKNNSKTLISANKMAIVVYAYNPNYEGGISIRITVRGPP